MRADIQTYFEGLQAEAASGLMRSSFYDKITHKKNRLNSKSHFTVTLLHLRNRKHVLRVCIEL